MALVMSFEDYVSQFGTISIVTGGTVAAGYSLDSLKTRQLGDVCRFNISADPMILRVAFSRSTTTAMAAAVLATSGITTDVIFRTYSTTTLRTTSSSYTMQSKLPWKPIAADLHDTPAAVVNRLEISFSQLAGATLDIGRLWYGPAFQSSNSSGLAWDTGPEDSGGVELSRGGQAYPRIGVVSRTVTLPMPHLTPAELYGVGGGSTGALSTVLLDTGVQSVGNTGEFLAFQESITNPMRPIYGHFKESPRFTANAHTVYESALSMREEL